MSENTPLGQNLFREAVAQNSLGPFDEAASQMSDMRIPRRCRADVYKAIRFGIAGLVINTWQESITEPLEEPIILGDITVAHKLSDQYFSETQAKELYESRRLDRVLMSRGRLEFGASLEGDFALDTIKRGSVYAMGDLFEKKDQLVLAEVTVADLVGTFKEYMATAFEQNLNTVPDRFEDGNAQNEHVYGKKIEEVDLARVMTGTAENAIRFSSKAISEFMVRASNPKQTKETYGLPKLPANFVISSIYGIMMHAARASQRQDGTRVVTMAEKTRTVFGTDYDRQGIPELVWPNKYLRPPKRLELSEDNPTPWEGDVTYLQRNKCPVGYTENAIDAMPIHKIYGGVLLDLHQKGLTEPMAFTEPTEVPIDKGSSYRGVIFS